MKLTRLFAVVLLTLSSWMSVPSHALTPEYFQLLNETQGFLKALAPTITRPPICTPAMVSEGQGAVERGIRNMAYKIIVIEPLESAAKLAATAAGLPGAVMTTYTMTRCAMDAGDSKAFVQCALGEAISFRGGEVLKELGVKNREQAIANYAWDQAYSTMVGAINQYQAAPEVFEYTESHGCQNRVQADWKKRRQPGAEGGQIVLVANSTKCACTRPNQIDHGSMRMVVPVRLVRTGNNQPGWSAGEPREIPITVACCPSPNAEQGVGVIPGGGVTYPRDQSVPLGPATTGRTATTGSTGPGRTATTGSTGPGRTATTGSTGPGDAIAIPGGVPPRPGRPGGAPITIAGGPGGSGAGTPATGGQRWSVSNPCPACQPIADALKASLAEEARLAPLLDKANNDLQKTILEKDALKPKIAALQSQINAMAGTGGESVDRDTGVRTESYVQPDGSVRIRTFDRTGKMTSETTRPYEAAQKAQAELAAANARLAVLNAQEPGQAKEAARLDDAVRTAERESERLRGALAACVEEKCKGDVAPRPAGRVGSDGTPSDRSLWWNPLNPDEGLVIVEPNPKDPKGKEPPKKPADNTSPNTGAWVVPEVPNDGFILPGDSTSTSKGKEPPGKKPADKEPGKKEGGDGRKESTRDPKGGEKPIGQKTPAGSGSGAGGGGGVAAVPRAATVAAAPSATAGTQCDCEAAQKNLLEARQKARELEEKAKAAREAEDRAFTDFLGVYTAVRDADPSLSRQQAMASPLAKEASQKSDQAKRDAANAQTAVEDQQAVIRAAQRAYDECLKRCREGGGGGEGGGVGVVPGGGVGVVPGEVPSVVTGVVTGVPVPIVGGVAPGPVSAGQPCDCSALRAALQDAWERQYQAKEGYEKARHLYSESDGAVSVAFSRARAAGLSGEEVRRDPGVLKEIEIRTNREHSVRGASSELDAASEAVGDAKKAYEDCLKRCADIPPTLAVAINTGGNAPWGPNPMGGRTATGGGGPPVQPGSPGTIQLSSSSYSGTEGGSVNVTVQRVGGKTGAVSVGYATGGGSATPGSDYAGTSGGLSWPDNDDSQKTITIALFEDTVVEETKTFNFIIAGPGGGVTLGSPNAAVISIADNDAITGPAGTLQFATSQFSTSEGASAVTITVTRSGGSNGAVGVSYSTSSNSAVAGQDFTAVNGTLQWPNGNVAAQTFSVPILNDTLVEQSESFSVTLSGPTGGATLGTPSTVSVAIQDDDVDTGPCGAQGNVWQGNTGAPYSCSGSCIPNAQSPVITVSGNVVTISNFHAGGSATFLGCGSPLTSTSNTLTYFTESNHTATITRISNSSWQASIMRNPPPGSCFFICGR